MTKKLDGILDGIPVYKTCVYSRVPDGRVWCDYFNQTPAGGCNKKCEGYTTKFR